MADAYNIQAINGCSGGNITLYGFAYPPASKPTALPTKSKKEPVIHGYTPVIAPTLIKGQKNPIPLFELHNTIHSQGTALYNMPNGEFFMINWNFSGHNPAKYPTSSILQLAMLSKASSYEIWYDNGTEYAKEAIWEAGADSMFAASIWISETGNTPPS